MLFKPEFIKIISAVRVKKNNK